MGGRWRVEACVPAQVQSALGIDRQAGRRDRGRSREDALHVASRRDWIWGWHLLVSGEEGEGEGEGSSVQCCAVARTCLHH